MTLESRETKKKKKKIVDSIQYVVRKYVSLTLRNDCRDHNSDRTDVQVLGN